MPKAVQMTSFNSASTLQRRSRPPVRSRAGGQHAEGALLARTVLLLCLSCTVRPRQDHHSTWAHLTQCLGPLASQNTQCPQLSPVVEHTGNTQACSLLGWVPLAPTLPVRASLPGQLPFPWLPLCFSWPWLMLFLLPRIPLFLLLPGKILIFQALL